MNGESLPPRGWYDDPADGARERYWDGLVWTQRVRRKAAPVRVRGPVALVPDAGEPGPAHSAPRPGPLVARSAAASGALGSDSVPLATWGRRVGAALLDLVFQALLLVAVLALARGFTDKYAAAAQTWAETLYSSLAAGQAAWPPLPPEVLSAANLLTGIEAGLAFVYSLAFLVTWGATPGMRLTGLRVIPAPALERVAAPLPRSVTVAQALAKLPVGRAVWRSLAWALLASGFSYLVFVQLFSLLQPLWHPRRQTLHDLVARTLVIRRAGRKL